MGSFLIQRLVYLLIASMCSLNTALAQLWEGSSFSISAYVNEFPTNFEVEPAYGHFFPNAGIRLDPNTYRPRNKETLGGIGLQLNYSYPIQNWLRGELTGYYVFDREMLDPVSHRADPSDPSSELSRGEQGFSTSGYGGKLALAIDLLWNSEFESLLIKGGIGMWSLRYTDFNTSQFTSDSQWQDLQLKRNLVYSRWEFGLEWRDFFSPHFGYHLGFDLGPSFASRVRSLELEKLRFDGERQPAEGTEIKRPRNEMGVRENYEHRFFYAVYLGLSYRL